MWNILIISRYSVRIDIFEIPAKCLLTLHGKEIVGEKDRKITRERDGVSQIETFRLFLRWRVQMLREDGWRDLASQWESRVAAPQPWHVNSNYAILTCRRVGRRVGQTSDIYSFFFPLSFFLTENIRSLTLTRNYSLNLEECACRGKVGACGAYPCSDV